MSQTNKSKYTEKQKRQAEKIEKSYLEKGIDKAEAIAWATVNERDGDDEKGFR